MGAAYRALPEDLRDAVEGTFVRHSAQRYFKIRPSDVYRPVMELLDEIEQETPTVAHPTVLVHPATGERVLYLSAGFAESIVDAAGNELDPGLLRRLLEITGQLDESFQHPGIHLQGFEEGDLLVWDNRSLIHRALHTVKPEPTASFRVTVHDQYPFYEGVATEQSVRAPQPV
jgi:taurine dioxygenase